MERVEHMSYSFETTQRFNREFKKLDINAQKLLKGWINKNLVDTPDPRKFGYNLKGDKKEQWRYRVGDYRIICIIEDDKLIINALRVSHRKDAYKK